MALRDERERIRSRSAPRVRNDRGPCVGLGCWERDAVRAFCPCRPHRRRRFRRAGRSRADAGAARDQDRTGAVSQ